MSSQKRLVLFLLLSVALMTGTQALMDALGLTPPRPPANAPAVADAPNPVGPAAVDPTRPAITAAAPGPAKPATSKKPEPLLAKSSELTLGASDKSDTNAYHLAVRFDQLGAGVREVVSSRFDGETIDGVPDRKTRLRLIADDPISHAPASFSMTVLPGGRRNAGPEASELALDLIRWEVVRATPEGPATHAVTRTPTETNKQAEGQEIAFRTTLENPNVTVTKRFRLWKGEDGFEMDLTFDGADKDTIIAYRLFGPHGVPIEGEWYTSTFRDIFFGQIKGATTEIVTKTAADVAKAKATPDSLSYQTLPIKFAGVENQYFAVFFAPDPVPTRDTRWDADARAFLASENIKAPQKSDVGVEITSIPITVGPNRPTTHTYQIYAGPKMATTLPAGAIELASYRKTWFSIPFAGTLAQNVIAPLLDKIYALTTQVARMFGFQNGSYGIAIILLTMTVRMIMFPLGRKQAMIAKKMQDLQPHLAVIKEKYKDDKERVTKETMALYKEHGFNPAAGCLPSLIQLPIFVGLWQALNNSVALRHSTFLYIKNLAAPDMLFTFPTEIPFLGKYFNLLPFGVVALMLVQTKLFTPPAMTDEAKMQQKMMKYMMIFMAFMFYKVPSGLGIYFITSSTWQIGERLLLPRLAARKAARRAAEDFNDDGSSKTIVEPIRPTNGAGNWLTKKLEKILAEANNERTIRNNGGSNGNTSSRDIPPDRNRPRPPRPGGKRR